MTVHDMVMPASHSDLLVASWLPSHACNGGWLELISDRTYYVPPLAENITVAGNHDRAAMIC